MSNYTRIHGSLIHLGTSTVGEYFNPALDCSDVVDRVSDATDGFYWIHSKTIKNVVKVCVLHCYGIDEKMRELRRFFAGFQLYHFYNDSEIMLN